MTESVNKCFLLFSFSWCFLQNLYSFLVFPYYRVEMVNKLRAYAVYWPIQRVAGNLQSFPFSSLPECLSSTLQLQIYSSQVVYILVTIPLTLIGLCLNTKTSYQTALFKGCLSFERQEVGGRERLVLVIKLLLLAASGVVGLPTSRWRLIASQNNNRSPGYRDQFPGRKWLLWKQAVWDCALLKCLSSPPQALLQEFSIPQRATL